MDNKFIDVETPAHKSDPFVLYVVNYTLLDTANKLIETEFPFHLRYQKAAEDSLSKRFDSAMLIQMSSCCTCVKDRKILIGNSFRSILVNGSL